MATAVTIERTPAPNDGTPTVFDLCLDKNTLRLYIQCRHCGDFRFAQDKLSYLLQTSPRRSRLRHMRAVWPMIRICFKFIVKHAACMSIYQEKK